MGNISYAGCLLISVRYAGKTGLNTISAEKTLLTSRSNRFFPAYLTEVIKHPAYEMLPILLFLYQKIFEF